MDVEISGSAVRGFPRRDIIAFINRCQKEIARLGFSRSEPRTVSVAFVDDQMMRQLNSRYRGKRRTTDVLTFSPGPDEENFESSLGEIVVSLEQAARQAREERHSLATELRYLLLHGILHAHGYDHETDDGRMNRIEVRVRPRVGLD